MEDFDLDIQKNEDEQSTLNYPLIIGLIIGILLIGGAAYWFFTKDDASDTTETEETVSTESQSTDEASEQVIDSTSYQNNEVSSDETSTNEENVTTDNEENVEASAATTSDERTDDTSVPVSNDNENTTSPDYTYFIVSGAFKDENNAQNKLKALKDEGYEAVITGPNQAGLYIVAYQGFSDIEAAKQKLNELRQQNPQAWIYKKQ